MAFHRGSVWLCQVSFDYYSEDNLPTQHVSRFAPRSSGGGRGPLRETRTRARRLRRTGLAGRPLKVSGKPLAWRTEPWARGAGPATPHLLGPGRPLLGVAGSLWLSQCPDCCTCVVPKGSGCLGNLSHERRGAVNSCLRPVGWCLLHVPRLLTVRSCPGVRIIKGRAPDASG